ncbi:hypothetical protein GCM10009789_35430 [Kribbella sancticallisti]|uniref:SH3b domain-containing protein n=1 Tax=Kribbella sancticallisti TaxID=460087 RepID=A0ABN2DJW5_9ACTN
MAIRIRLRTVVAATATAVLPLGSLAAAAPQAQAATTYRGKVVASALNVRSAPTAAAGRVGTLRNGTTISIQCKVYGPSVRGNARWYKLSTGKWVTARYVANIGPAPRWCGDGRESEGRVVASTSLSIRSGPHTANTKVSSAPRGALLPIVCKVNSQMVGGNPRWYQLTGDGGGQWVSARYVSNVGSPPPFC